MILDYLTLGLVVIIEIIIITQIFTFTRNNVEDKLVNNIVIHSFELVTLLVAILLVMYQSIRKSSDSATLTFLMIFTAILICVIWGVVRIRWLRTNYKINMGVSKPEEKVVFKDSFREDNNSKSDKKKPEAVPKERSDKDFVVFSKYADKTKANNFSFEALYPDYDGKSVELDITKGSKDYSAYNGYPEGHICSGCSCMKREDGYVFCGKFIPGMGTIGCSPRWDCLNCKKCKQGRNTTVDYTCDNCKCHKTDQGYICGKQDRKDGYIHKCRSSCEKCDECYGADSGNLLDDAGMTTVKPYSSLDKVKVDNASSILNNL
tara:strand:- start:49 stop:1005 length:957 start_codon:yes stop_codon:yes gene_type:complete